jgi:hypothetical protein
MPREGDSRKAAKVQREEPLGQFTWQYKVTSIDYELALYVTGIGPTITVLFPHLRGRGMLIPDYQEYNIN